LIFFVTFLHQGKKVKATLFQKEFQLKVVYNILTKSFNK